MVILLKFTPIVALVALAFAAFVAFEKRRDRYAATPGQSLFSNRRGHRRIGWRLRPKASKTGRKDARRPSSLRAIGNHAARRIALKAPRRHAIAL